MSQLSALKTLGSEVDRLRSNVRGFADEWAQAEQQIQTHAEAAQATADAAESQIGETLARLQETNRTVLDEMQEELAKFSDNPWAQFMDETIRAVEDGKLTIEEFRRFYGDVIFELKEGRVLTSQWLLELDAGQFRRKAQEIRRAISDEAIGIEEIVELLRQSTDAWAASLVRLFEAFKEGKISVEAVIEEARNAERATGANSQVGTLAEGLGDLLSGALEDYT